MLWYGVPQSHWRKYQEGDIFRYKGEITQILQSVGIANVSFKVGNESGFQTILKIYSGKTQIGRLGTPEGMVLKHYDINNSPTVCDLSVNVLRELWQNKKMTYKAPVQFPSMSRDIALQVTRNVSAGDLLNTIRKEGGNNLINISLFDVYQSEEVGDEDKSLAFSLKFQSDTKTLTDDEVDQDVVRILKSLKTAHRAIQR